MDHHLQRGPWLVDMRVQCTRPQKRLNKSSATKFAFILEASSIFLNCLQYEIERLSSFAETLSFYIVSSSWAIFTTSFQKWFLLRPWLISFHIKKHGAYIWVVQTKVLHLVWSFHSEHDQKSRVPAATLWPSHTSWWWSCVCRGWAKHAWMASLAKGLGRVAIVLPFHRSW